MKNLFFILLTVFTFNFSLLPFNCKAQWQQTNLNSGGIDCFAIKGDSIFAGNGINGVCLSTNNGNSWAKVNNGLTATIGTDTVVFSLAINGSNIFAATAGGIFISSNSGSSWTYDHFLSFEDYLDAIAISGGNIIAGSNSCGVYLSSDIGNSWDTVKVGKNDYDVLALATKDGNTIFAGTTDGVFLSSNNGISWDSVNTGITPNTNVISLAIKGDTIYAGTIGDGVYLSSNNGSSWSSLTGSPDAIALAINGNYIFAGTQGSGVFLSSNNGSSWSAVSYGLTNSYVYSLVINGNYIFAGTGSGVWRLPLSEVGIEEINDNKSNIEVYPNPVTDILQIQTSLQIKCIEVFDITGRQIYATTAKTINCGGFSSGVYFIKATTEKGVVVKKFMKE
jgi:hypothetical protein